MGSAPSGESPRITHPVLRPPNAPRSPGRGGQPTLTSAPRFSLPSRAVETLRVMLVRGGSEEVARTAANAGAWDLMASPERHHDGIAVLAG